MITTRLKDDKLILTIKGSITSDMETEIESVINMIQFEEYSNIKDVVLRINSPGGSIMALFGILDTLKSCDKNLIAYNTGVCASAAAVLFMSCDVRYCFKHSLLMIHNANGIDDDQLLNKFTQAVSELMLTYFDAPQLKKLMDNETWMNADEMNEYGIISEKNMIDSNLTVDVANSSIESIYEVCNVYIQESDVDNMTDDIKKDDVIVEDNDTKIENVEDTVDNTVDNTAVVEAIKEEVETVETKDEEPIKIEEIKDETDIETDIEITATQTDVNSIGNEEFEAINNELVDIKAKFEDLQKEYDILNEAKINEEKEDLLNVNFLNDKEEWKKLDLDTIKNLLNTIEVKELSIKKPVLDVKNELSFDEMTVEERQELHASDPVKFLKLVQNRK